MNMPDQCYTTSMASDWAGNLFITGTANGGVMLGPSTVVSAGSSDMFMAKINNVGSILWGVSGGGSDQDVGYNITIDICGHVWVVGGCGEMPVTGIYNMTFDGHTVSVPLESFDPVFLVEYDTLGNYITGTALASGSDDGFNSIIPVVDRTGDLFVTSDYVHTQMTIGGDVLDTSLTNPGELLYIARYKYDTVLCPAVTLSVEKQTAGLQSDDVFLYPNPATYEFKIALGGNYVDATAELFDISGRLVRTYPLTGVETSMTIDGISPAIYFCRIHTRDGGQVVKKLVIGK